MKRIGIARALLDYDGKVMSKVRFEARYGDMSEEERWNSIREKYEGKQTTLSYLSYTSDLVSANLISFDGCCDLQSAAIRTASKKACVTLGIAPGGNRSIAYFDEMSRFMEEEELGFDTILKNFIRSNELLTRTQSAAYRPLADRLLGKLGFDLSD